MGFQLTKLMQQYGVSTPTIAPYTGTVATAQPTDTTKEDYAAKLAEWKKTTEQEAADREKYERYVADYQNRLLKTPEYLDKQYQIAPGTKPMFAPTYSGAYNWNRDVTNPAAVAPGGLDRMDQNLVNWFKRNPDATTADVRAMLRKYEISENDVRNAMGTGFAYGEAGPGGKSGYYKPFEGDYWGTPLKAPTYTPTPSNACPAGYHWDMNAGACVQDTPTCDDGFYYDPNTKSCQPIGDDRRTRPPGPTDPNVQIAGISGVGGVGGVGTGAGDATQLQTFNAPTYYPQTVLGTESNDAAKLESINLPTYYPQTVLPLQQLESNVPAPQPFTPNPMYPTFQDRIQTMQFSHGGGVKTHYYDGGLKPVSGDPNDISSIYGGLPEVGAKTAPPAAPAAAAPAAAAPSMEDPLMAMLSKYASPTSSYGAELTAARKKVGEQSQAFNDMIQKFLTDKEEPMSQSEKYFRLAAAFGAPTKTGHFTEALGNVSKEAAEQRKEERLSAKEKRQLALQLGLKSAEMGLSGAKEDLATLRTLSAQEMKDKSDLVKEAMKDYINSGKPQSEAGKMAKDLGLTPGTPEYNAKVQEFVNNKLEAEQARVLATTANMSIAQANLALATEKAKQLTPQEVKLKDESEEKLQALRTVEGTLKQAFAVNDKTFDGTLLQTGQKKFLENFDSEDPRVIATRTQANLLSQSAVEKLRNSFGGNPTEGERAILLSLEGIEAKSKAERKAIMLQAWGKLQSAIEFRQKKLNEISSGLYRNVQSATELK